MDMIATDRPLYDASAVQEAPTPEPACDWKPLYDKILVRREKPRDTYDAAGTLVVADQHKETQNRGEVLAVGEGRLSLATGALIELKVKPGMQVLFGKHSGIDVEGFKDLVILREDELLGYR